MTNLRNIKIKSSEQQKSCTNSICDWFELIFLFYMTVGVFWTFYVYFVHCGGGAGGFLRLSIFQIFTISRVYGFI